MATKTERWVSNDGDSSKEFSIQSITKKKSSVMKYGHLLMESPFLQRRNLHSHPELELAPSWSDRRQPQCYTTQGRDSVLDLMCV